VRIEFRRSRVLKAAELLQIVSSPAAMTPRGRRTYASLQQGCSRTVGRVDPTEKLNVIESALPSGLRRRVFHVEDRLIAWLSSEKISGVQRYQEPVNQGIAVPDSG
jgi:hypothetical protein